MRAEARQERVAAVPNGAKAQVFSPANDDPAVTGGPLAPEDRGRRTWLARVAREPLTHFVIVGALLFALGQLWSARGERYAISVGPDQLERIAQTYAQQYGEAPDRAAMKAMVDGFVREEILRREGMALGLDADDEIVRRRIAQKYEFIMQDHASPRAPMQADLESWYAGHRAAYLDPARRSLDQVYFAADPHGDGSALRLATHALESLRAGRTAPAGDVFPGPPQIRLLSQAEVDRLFGGTKFAAQVFAAPAGQWAGPFRSAFGWHLVRVSEARAGEPRPFAAVADRVAADWTEAQRRVANAQAFAALRARYAVTEPGWLK
jgi:peptidyl-prolyl cis-trans isomerase C